VKAQTNRKTAVNTADKNCAQDNFGILFSKVHHAVK